MVCRLFAQSRTVGLSVLAMLSFIATPCLCTVAHIALPLQENEAPRVQAATLSSLGGPFETKGSFVQDLAKTFGCKPLIGGHSPYHDVPTASALWGWVGLGLRLGVVEADSPTQFGVGDVLTWQTVTTGSLSYLHVPLDQGITPYAWAKRERLYPVAQSPLEMASTASVSHTDAMAFLTRLKSLADLLKSMPNSWSLRGVEAGLLSRALSNTERSGFGQSTALLSIRVAAQSTGGDAKVRSSEIAALNHAQQMRIVTLSAEDGGQKQSYVTMTPVGSSTGGVVREYQLGNTLYIDSGDGWHQLALTPDQQPPMEPQMPDVRMGQITHVTAERTRVGYVFRGQLQTAGLVDLIQPLIASITMQPHAAAMSRAQPSESPFSALLKRMSANFAVGVTLQKGKPLISQQSSSLYVDVPPAVLFGGASDNFKDIADLRFQETVTTTTTFHQTLVLPPSDLRALLKKTAASNTSHQSASPGTPVSGNGTNTG